MNSNALTNVGRTGTVIQAVGHTDHKQFVSMMATTRMETTTYVSTSWIATCIVIWTPVWQQIWWECSSPLFTNDFSDQDYIYYTSLMTMRGQRLQWSFTTGNIVGDGQQQKQEQCNSDLYLVCSYNQSIASLSAWCAGSVCSETPHSVTECMVRWISVQWDTVCVSASACQCVL